MSLEFTYEHHLDLQKQAYRSYNNQPTIQQNMLQIQLQFHKFQQLSPLWKNVPYDLHTSSNIHDTMETGRGMTHTPMILPLCFPEVISKDYFGIKI